MYVSSTLKRFHLQIILNIEKNKTATDDHMFVHHSCFSSKIVIIRLDCNVMFIHITKEEVLSVMLHYLYLSYYSEHGLILLKMNSDYYYLFLSFWKCNIFGTVSKMFYNLFPLGNKKNAFRSMKDYSLPAFLCSRVIIYI